MKLKFLAAALAVACLATSACATTNPALNAVGKAIGDAPIAGTTTADEKALIGVESSYNVLAYAYLTADDAGQLPPALKAKVKSLVQRAGKAVLAARQAKAVGDAKGLFKRIDEAKRLIDAGKALLGVT